MDLVDKRKEKVVMASGKNHSKWEETDECKTSQENDHSS
jgi:hypothetical protein